MSKIGKFWLFGKQEEPAEDFDMDYDNIYYEDTPTTSQSDEAEAASDKMPLFGADGYNNAYGADMSDVKVVDEKAEEPEEEPLYKVVFAPEAYRDCGEIVESFKLGRVVVIETADLSREEFIRMMDYVMGALHALDGELVRLDGGVVVLFPAEVDPEMDIDEIEDEPEELFDDEEYDDEDSDEEISEE